MARKRMFPRASRCAAAEMPDWRAVGLSLVLMTVLALMLQQRPAQAGDIDFVCWDLDNGELECDTFASVQATCELLDYNNDLCEVVRNTGRPASRFAAQKSTPIKLNRADAIAWQTARASAK